jgi:allantoicase
VEVDTHHFKGNYPDSCLLEGVVLERPLQDFANATGLAWETVLPRTQLQPHHRHTYRDELLGRGPYTHLRLSIFPDGGISRLRVWGRAR